MKYFFSADSHYSHFNIIKYCNRPFPSEKHDQELFDRWNSKVTNDDTVYFLGDLSFQRPERFLEKLNFKTFIWVLGNHDKRNQKPFLSNGREVKVRRHMECVKINGIPITMCHFAMRKWDKSHYGAWHLYGHSHGNLPPLGLSMDVGVDAHDYYPVSFDEVKAFMNKRLKEYSPYELGFVKPINPF